MEFRKVLLASLGAVLVLISMVSGGSISGHVVNSTGANFSNVLVTAINTYNGNTYQNYTNSSGNFNVTGLDDGDYTLDFSYPDYFILSITFTGQNGPFINNSTNIVFQKYNFTLNNASNISVSVTCSPSSIYEGSSSSCVAKGYDNSAEVAVNVTWTSSLGSITPTGENTATYYAPSVSYTTNALITATDIGANSSGSVYIKVLNKNTGGGGGGGGHHHHSSGGEIITPTPYPTATPSPTPVNETPSPTPQVNITYAKLVVNKTVFVGNWLNAKLVEISTNNSLAGKKVKVTYPSGKSFVISTDVNGAISFPVRDEGIYAFESGEEDLNMGKVTVFAYVSVLTPSPTAAQNTTASKGLLSTITGMFAANALPLSIVALLLVVLALVSIVYTTKKEFVSKEQPKKEQKPQTELPLAPEKIVDSDIASLFPENNEGETK